MRNKIKTKLGEISNEDNTYGEEGIRDKILELNRIKKEKTKARSQLNKEIKRLNNDIDYWKNIISPEQTSMF